jgi:hypothetical protein
VSVCLFLCASVYIYDLCVCVCVTGNPDDWEKIYNEDFMPAGLTKEQEKNVLGGATGKHAHTDFLA